TGAILVYGGEPGAVRDLASRIVRHIAGSLDDPFRVTLLDETALSGEPARLIDEVLSLSFAGGDRVVWVRSAGESFLKAVEPVLKGSVRGNMIVAEAGSLAKSSGLRGKFEASDHAVILPLYEADGAAIASAIKTRLRQMGFGIGAEATARLVELLGRGGGALQSEIEKLAAYCHGQQTVSLSDVEAICGDGLWAETGDLADAVFAGRVADTDRFFLQLVTSGVDPGRILSAVHAHALRLIEFRQKVERGLAIEQALKQARPPIFFKRQSALENQLANWSSELLLPQASSLHAAILQARLNAALAESLANRAVLAVARSARSAGRA
ncbi:MAG: DNA polymerase III subunit delta, partial [Aestuariivirga sp.]